MCIKGIKHQLGMMLQACHPSTMGEEEEEGGRKIRSSRLVLAAHILGQLEL